MASARKIIVQLAMSLDGYIARPDGDVEWLNSRARLDYGMSEFQSTIDTVLIGRKTYDWAMDYARKTGMKESVFDPKLLNYVFSRRPPQQAAAGAQFVSGPVKEFAQRLRAAPGKNIWMMGGGDLIASFLDAGEIDEFELHVVPVLIGEGIPLIAPRHRELALHLRSIRSYPDGVVRLHYDVAWP
jgi:dihydrofolate reductase